MSSRMLSPEFLKKIKSTKLPPKEMTENTRKKMQDRIDNIDPEEIEIYEGAGKAINEFMKDADNNHRFGH